MKGGRILVGEHDGVHVLKFTGDVRVTLCATVDGFLRDLLRSDRLTSVLVDLTETEGIDSTSLGLLARLSIETRRRVDQVPTLVSTRPDITRLLRTMGFDDVFTILEEPLEVVSQTSELVTIKADEEDLRQRVIEAHRALMNLNEGNREKFHDLVTVLEESMDYREPAGQRS